MALLFVLILVSLHIKTILGEKQLVDNLGRSFEMKTRNNHDSLSSLGSPLSKEIQDPGNVTLSEKNEPTKLCYLIPPVSGRHPYKANTQCSNDGI